MSIASRPTVGSLCSGYGGLELAIREIFGAEPAWLSELHEIQDTKRAKPRPNPVLQVLEKRYPGIPNLGDLDMIEWELFHRVSLLAAGFPCQPVSSAGRQLGDNDPRWKWPGVRRAIIALLPPLVVLENVANIVSMQGGSLFAGILADLRAIGYSVVWGVFGACLEEVSGCHHRHRMFLLARRIETGDAPEAKRWPGKACGVPPKRKSLLAMPAARDGNSRGEGSAEFWAARSEERTNGATLGAQVGLLFPTPTTRDGLGGPGSSGRDGGLNLRTAVTLLPTPRATDGTNGGPNMRGSKGDLTMPSAVQPERFGQYAWAVERWFGEFGLPPEPTEIGPRGGVRLAPVFPEWMMGLEPGYVTDLLPRNDALRTIGNGVFPRQAVVALRHLIAMTIPDIRDFRARKAARIEMELAA